MATQTDIVIKPPYVSFATFINTLNRLRDTGIPDRIDPTVFPSQSGSTVAALLQAIKFFGFVDENGKPQEVFKSLVEADDNARSPILKDLLREKYTFVTDSDFSLANATSGQVEKAFRDQGLNGSTIIKSVSFFLAVAEMAGLKTSPHVKAPKAPRSNGSGKVKRRVGAGVTVAEPSSVPAPLPRAGNAATLLLDKFPNFDPGWPDELKTKWFDSFSHLQKLMTSEEEKS